MPGLTAWVGLKLVELKAGDRVFISGGRRCRRQHRRATRQAARLLRRRQRRVGREGRAAYERAGIRRGVQLSRRGSVRCSAADGVCLRQRLTAAAPDGIDVYFDNVGGDHLEAAIACMRDHGRIAACGSISRYNDEGAQAGPRNMLLVVTRRLTMRGFIVLDWVREREAVPERSGAARRQRSAQSARNGHRRARQRAPRVSRNAARGQYGEDGGQTVVGRQRPDGP